jgi:drug/metabolite transporter (DMT)-like permease
MTGSVMILVLLAALLHAGWNAVIKAGGDKLREAILIAGGAAMVSAMLLPLVPLPAAASLPWLAVSVLIHHLYYVLVAAAYRAGDMSHTYPLMRGSAPMLVACASAPLIGESLSVAGWCGIGLICGGILTLAIHRGASRRATALALGNALVIALYTLIDGAGARASGAPVSYVLWLTTFSAAGLVGWLIWRDRTAAIVLIQQRGWIALGGGACSVASYGLALWAMTQAPVAAVAALRETSVLFGIAIASLVLGERGGARRIIAAMMMVAGAATLRLA